MVIIAVGDDTLEFASFGETKTLCKEARAMGDVAYDAIYKHLSLGGIEESIRDVRDEHDLEYVADLLSRGHNEKAEARRV